MAFIMHTEGLQYLLKLLNKDQAAPTNLYMGLGDWTAALGDGLADITGEPTLPSGLGLDGTLSSATWTTRGTDNAVAFNGSSGYAYVPHNAAFSRSGKQDLTIEFYAKFGEWGSGWDCILRKGVGASDGESNYSVFGTVSSALRFSWNDSSLGDQTILDDSGWSPADYATWYHLAWCVDWTAMKVRFYVDGTLKSNLDINGSAGGFTSNTNNLFMGADGGSSSYWNGSISQVRLSSNARYSGNFTPADPLGIDANAIDAWPMTEGTGTTFGDATVPVNGYERKLIVVNSTNLPVAADGNGQKMTIGTGWWTADGGNLGPFTRWFLCTSGEDNSGKLLCSCDLEDGETTITDGNTYNLPNAAYMKLDNVA